MGRDRGPSWIRVATLTALGLVALAYVASIAGAAFYEGSRSAVARGDDEGASASLDVARSLDSSLALYARAQGFIQLASGDFADAVDSLERATRLAPADDQAWRGLALARHGLGETDAAAAALEAAVDRQRSDPVNLMLAVQLGTATDPEDVLAEIVLAWPQVVGAPGWDAFAGMPSDDVIDAALERWQHTPDSPEREVDQAILLASWAARPDLLEEAIAASPLADELARAVAASAACDAATDDLLDGIPSAARRSAPYWALRIREADDEASRARSERVYEIMTGRSLEHRLGSGSLNPLASADLAAFNLDEWGYRRPPFPDVPWSTALPSPNAGRVLWIEGAPIGSACGG